MKCLQENWLFEGDFLTKNEFGGCQKKMRRKVVVKLWTAQFYRYL